MTTSGSILALLLTAFSAGQAPNADGLITVESAHSVDETQTQLERAIEENGLMLLTTVAHDQNAANADLNLRPTRLLIFGNPQAGTPLMQAKQTVAIDLPQKMLIWEDIDGTVWLAYNDPRYLMDRHGIAGMDELAKNISNALQGLAEAATAP